MCLYHKIAVGSYTCKISIYYRISTIKSHLMLLFVATNLQVYFHQANQQHSHVHPYYKKFCLYRIYFIPLHPYYLDNTTIKFKSIISWLKQNTSS